MKKSLKNLAPVVLFFLPLTYFFPKITVFYFVCGIYDVARIRKLNASIVCQYFLGNGILTWLLSPFNILMDILALPYVNKGIYKLEDLPESHQEEIQCLIDFVRKEDLVCKLEERTRNLSRSMIFFKWYGANINNFLEVPVFHKKFKYIQTVGISVFNKKESTSRHFGPIRATLRVLYNINAIEDNSAYIEVGETKNYWRESKLFIFDDTLLHQSFNESDRARYCLFVDILRPTVFPRLLAFIVSVIRFLLRGINSIFYKNWEMIKS